MNVTVSIFLVEDHNLIFREWDGTAEQMDARVNNSVVVPLMLDYDPSGDNPLEVCERIYALCNEHPRTPKDREQEMIYRQAYRARSLSVGDVVYLPDSGYYCVGNFGFNFTPYNPSQETA